MFDTLVQKFLKLRQTRVVFRSCPVNDFKLLAIIPARGGSKGIINKNIKPLFGRPLIHYTIDAALLSGIFDRILVSTDSEKIAQLSLIAGAEVPFMRPIDLAQDDTSSADVILHVIQTLSLQGYSPTHFCLLQPTSPLRNSDHIKAAWSTYKRTGVDSLVSIIQVPHIFNPSSQYIAVNGVLSRISFGDDQCHTRQSKKPYYARNGAAIYISSLQSLLSTQQILGGSLYGFEMDRLSSIDIDSSLDMRIAELRLMGLL